MQQFKMAGRLAMLLLGCGLLAHCGGQDRAPAKMSKIAQFQQGNTPPTQITADKNAAVLEQLPFNNRQDFADAKRGLIATLKPLVVKRKSSGAIIWDQARYGFETGAAPASVNPSLWRQAKLNHIHGLFKVTDRIYQLRGFDLANMTLIQGDSGWIIVDPLTTKQTATTAWNFAMQHLPKLPIQAVIFTHSHVDHFGGINGVLTASQAAKNKVRIIAPIGFTEEATSENVMAGIAMQRRAAYQYGAPLERSVRGHVDLGLGKEVPFGGTVGFMRPTEWVDHTGQTLTIDGLKFVFQYAPDSEAPTEMAFYLPSLKALCGAELATHTLHNLYTLRGAKVRDALKWSGYLNQMTQLFADVQVYYASHHWPLWGNARIMRFIKAQRDVYRYIHDQTLRLANAGATPREIANQLQLPPALAQRFAERSYYGTISHNARAVYQFYFGWYDGNPAHLNRLPPVAVSKKYVAAMGGAQAVLKTAQAAFDNGEYRWVAELLNHLVFAQPDDDAAKALLAQTYDQLGYQAESGPWRDEYLTAAYELRHGGPKQGVNMADAMGLLRAIPLQKFFMAMATRLNGPDAVGENLAVNFIFTDEHQAWHLWIENAVLHSAPLKQQKADVTLKLTHALFLKMVTGQASAKDLLLGDALDVDGSRLDLVRFFGLFDKPDGRFAIVTP